MLKKFILTEKEANEIVYKIKAGISTFEKESTLYNISKPVFSKAIKKYYPNLSVRLLCNFHKTNHDFFDIMGPIQYYIMGLIAADGSLKHKDWGGGKTCFWRIALHQKDKNLLEKINSVMKNKNPIRYDKLPKETPMACLSVNSIKMVEQLIELKITPRKSLTYEIHSSFFENGDLFWHFLRGLFDGDGSISSCNSDYTKVNGDTQKKFAVDICGSKTSCQQISTFLFEEYNFGTGKISKNGPNCWRVRIMGNKQLERLYQLLYKDAELFLERKHNKFLELIDENVKTNSRLLAC